MGAGGAEEASTEPARPRYFTPTEVGAHNNPDDVWVSFLGGVYDLTPLSANGENGVLLQPLLDVAGTDISHWFDASTGDLKRSVDPVTNLGGYHVPMGRFVHVPPADPSADWSTSFGTPWWKNAGLRVGDLTACTRLVRIKNVLTAQEATLEVPEEETVGEIRERYLAHNWHAKGYTWKVMKRTPPEDGAEEATATYEWIELDMDKTLADNGVPDQAPDFAAVGIDEDYYVPVIHVYFKDALTVA